MGLEGDSLLVYVPSPPPDGWLDDMIASFPGLRARWVLQPVGPDGKLVHANDLPPEIWDGVTILCSYHNPRADLIPDVRYVQLASAGSDLWKTHPKYLDPGVPFSKASGCNAPQIAELVIGTWISHLHRFEFWAEQQRNETWCERTDLGVTDSWGRRMGILGYGAIGRQCARLAKGLGMEIYVYTSSERPTPESRRDETYCVPGAGDPEGALPSKWFSGTSEEAINNFLGQDLDILVVCVPLNDSTRGLIGPAQFQVLGRKKAFLSNVARGPVVDTDALVDALNKGLIRGAALDVTDPEPLPRGHPLWKAPNVFITPHCAWQSTKYPGVLAGLLKENLSRLADGRPLLNLDKK